MQFKHTTEEIVGWLKETEVEFSKFVPRTVTSEIENSQSRCEHGKE